MRSRRGVILGLMLGGAAAGAMVFSGCSSSSDDDRASTTVDSGPAESGSIVTEAAADTGAGICVQCAIIIDANRRPTGQVTTCDNNSVGKNGESSKQLLDIAFGCVCQKECAAECGDTCGSGTALSPVCTVCASAKCGTEFAACQADDPDIVKDSGTSTPTDSGSVDDSGSTADSAVDDAAIGQ